MNLLYMCNDKKFAAQVLDLPKNIQTKNFVLK